MHFKNLIISCDDYKRRIVFPNLLLTESRPVILLTDNLLCVFFLHLANVISSRKPGRGTQIARKFREIP